MKLFTLLRVYFRTKCWNPFFH